MKNFNILRNKMSFEANIQAKKIHKEYLKKMEYTNVNEKIEEDESSPVASRREELCTIFITK